MPEMKFTFYFPDLDQDRQTVEVSAWGGHIGTAFNRAWRALRRMPKYQGIKNLRPISVGIAVGPPVRM